jgi:hypothetical protein
MVWLPTNNYWYMLQDAVLTTSWDCDVATRKQLSLHNSWVRVPDLLLASCTPSGVYV